MSDQVITATRGMLLILNAASLRRLLRRDLEEWSA